MALVVVNAEFLLDDLGDTAAGPDITAAAVSLGAVPKEVGNQVSLAWEQLALRSGTQAGAQRVRATLSCGTQPLTERGAADAQSRSDLALGPALLTQLPGAHPPPLAPIRWGRSFSTHT